MNTRGIDKFKKCVVVGQLSSKRSGGGGDEEENDEDEEVEVGEGVKIVQVRLF